VQALREGAQDYLIKGEADGRLLARVLRYAIERKQAEQERERLIEELDAFAHTVAHDLKNPMFVLTATAQLLLEGSESISPEEVSHSLQTIVWNGRKMNNIVDGLLLLAGVRQQEITIQPLDMTGIIAEARQRLGHLIETRQVEITAPSSWPRALGYGSWVEEVWVNYLSNAIKYGGQPPRLELGATEQKDGLVCFWIRDNGPGLTPEEQARLFTPFARLNQVQTQGHGLGLSIARRIVEKLGGQVSVESNGTPGQGSVFCFTLPVSEKADLMAETGPKPPRPH
jgi:two-component system, sensor histidine kinase and response regulator